MEREEEFALVKMLSEPKWSAATTEFPTAQEFHSTGYKG